MNKVTQILNDFLKTQGYAEDEIHAEFIAEDDSYYDESSSVPLIVLGGMTNKMADEIFMKYCKEELGLNVDVDVITLSFLHELGHHNTIEFLDDEEMEASELTKFMLNIKNETNQEFTEKDYMRYFTCPIEVEATMDAVAFCNHNPEVAKELDASILQAIWEVLYV